MNLSAFRSDRSLSCSTGHDESPCDSQHIFDSKEYSMSFSLFLICMRNGEPATFKTALFDEVMGRQAIDPEFPLYAVKYSDGGCDEIRNDATGEDEIESVSFS